MVCFCLVNRTLRLVRLSNQPRRPCSVQGTLGCDVSLESAPHSSPEHLLHPECPLWSQALPLHLLWAAPVASPPHGLACSRCPANATMPEVWLPSLSQTQPRCIHGIQASIARSFASLTCILFYRLQVFVHPRVSLLLPGLSLCEGSREHSRRVYEDKRFHISWVSIYEHFGVYGEAWFSFVRSC